MGLCFCEPRKFYLERREGTERDRMLREKTQASQSGKGQAKKQRQATMICVQREQEQAYKWFCSIPGTFLINTNLSRDPHRISDT